MMDKKEALKKIKEGDFNLEDADKEIRADKEIVMAAVREWGPDLEFADDSLKADKDVVLAAIKDDGQVLEYADASLKSNKDVVLVAIKNSGSALEYTDESFKSDKKIVLLAVQHDGNALEYASQSLKGDKDIVDAAVAQNEMAIQFASDSLLTSKANLLESVKQCINKSGEPVACKTQYGTWIKEKEIGVLTSESKKIDGYVLWQNKSNIIFSWNLPDSSKAVIDSLNIDWESHEEIKFDGMEVSEDSEGKGSEAYDKDDNEIVDFQDFEGDGDTEIIFYGPSTGLWGIYISLKDNQAIIFENMEGAWTMGTPDGNKERIKDQQTVIELVGDIL